MVGVLRFSVLFLVAFCGGDGETTASPDVVDSGPFDDDGNVDGCAASEWDESGLLQHVGSHPPGAMLQHGRRATADDEEVSVVTGSTRSTTTLSVSTTARTNASAIIVKRYKEQAYMANPRLGSDPWKPPVFLVSTLPELRHRAAFNPSVVKLPKSLATAIHPQAYFLVALRHVSDQCGNLGGADEIKARGGRMWLSSSALVLDREFRPLLGAPFLRNGRYHFCEDSRLFILGETILAHCVHGSTNTWYLFELVVQKTGSSLNAEIVDYIPEGANTSIELHDARNIGLLWDGHPARLSLIFLVASPTMDVRDLLAQPSQRNAPFLNTWHNNGNPIQVPQSTVMLGVGHTHGQSGVAHYGNDYVHFFYLFDRQVPHALVGRSEPFCFPSREDTSKCETIQFIGSWEIDDDDVVIAYGINDCEAAVRRIPLKAVIDSIF